MCNVFNVDLNQAVTARFKAIEHSLVRRSGEYEYCGTRVSPENLGWRFRQRVCGHLQAVVPASLPRDVLSGKFDSDIQSTLDDAASAEWFYRNEKAY